MGKGAYDGWCQALSWRDWLEFMMISTLGGGVGSDGDVGAVERKLLQSV